MAKKTGQTKTSFNTVVDIIGVSTSEAKRILGNGKITVDHVKALIDHFGNVGAAASAMQYIQRPNAANTVFAKATEALAL